VRLYLSRKPSLHSYTDLSVGVYTGTQPPSALSGGLNGTPPARSQF
ncbi:hypothetical protein A2U01_0083198, partial [Trifolium medium]|nr:hypothetical protein [Trifolium medium]